MACFFTQALQVLKLSHMWNLLTFFFHIFSFPFYKRVLTSNSGMHGLFSTTISVNPKAALSGSLHSFIAKFLPSGVLLSWFCRVANKIFWPSSEVSGGFVHCMLSPSDNETDVTAVTGTLTKGTSGSLLPPWVALSFPPPVADIGFENSHQHADAWKSDVQM